MSDYRVENLAKTMVYYSTKVKPKDRAAIVTSPAAIPLVKDLYKHILRAGGYPYVFMGFELQRGIDELGYIFFKEANDDQLKHLLETEKMILGEFDVMYSIRASENTRTLSTIDSARQAAYKNNRSQLMNTYLQRSADGDFRWVAAMYPTHAYAQDAEMSLEEFEEYVYKTTYSDTDDPVGAWNAIHDEQQKLVDWLHGKKQVEVRGPNAELTLSIAGRPFIKSDGTFNMPSGEIFTGPVEDSAEGWVRFTYPAVLDGKEVEGVELRFEAGKVVQATAEKNEDFLHQILATDEGASYLGEFAIGTNKMINRFIKNILFDEKIGGTIHMAVGAGYPSTGSVNKSGVHWDMICDMRDGGQILVDDELFYESGEFKI
jgi:aminopeptidase